MRSERCLAIIPADISVGFDGIQDIPMEEVLEIFDSFDKNDGTARRHVPASLSV
jgi:hypothetical protein